MNDQGEMELRTAQGKVIFRAPTVYQENRGQKNNLEGHYQLEDRNRVGFEVKNYDHSKPLVIDPVLDYSTYLGGSAGDESYGVAVDSSGDAYSTGFTFSTNFPATAGAYQTTLGFTNAFVTKLDPNGALVYSTYVGAPSGTGDEQGNSIAVDSSGDAYVTGQTSSTNFPTVNPVQTALAGYNNAFVFKLNSAGSSLLYSTFWGGNNNTYGRGLALDSSGNIYVCGQTHPGGVWGEIDKAVS